MKELRGEPCAWCVAGGTRRGWADALGGASVWFRRESELVY
jgi:hypothetical protein